VACIQETRWKGSGCKFCGAKDKRYKLFWMSEERSDGVEIFIAKKWVVSVVSIKRHSKRALILKMVLDNCLLNVLTVYAPHSGKLKEEKENFWNKMFSFGECILQNEIVVLAGDMNGHVSSNVGYDGTHGSLCMEIGIQMDSGS